MRPIYATAVLAVLAIRPVAAQAPPITWGQFATAAANQHHYAITPGRTIVQVHAMGPFLLTYVNPADDPSKKAKIGGPKGK